MTDLAKAAAHRSAREGMTQKEVRARAAAIVLERDGLQAAGWRLLRQYLHGEMGGIVLATPEAVRVWMDGYQFSIEDHLKAVEP